MAKQTLTPNQLSEFSSGCLPDTIANGLPPAMAALSKDAYWGTGDHDGLNRATRGIMGIPPTRFLQKKADCTDGTLNHLLRAQGKDPIGNATARRVFNHLCSTEGEIISLVPHKRSVAAPDQIKVYTDGSWAISNPKKWFLGFGVAGVFFWPWRSSSRENLGEALVKYHPLSVGESMVAHPRQESWGISLCSSVAACIGNSTRAEINAGLIALMAEGPIHIGSDGRTLVDRANAITKRLHKHEPFRRPWGGASDGSLWEHFVKAVRAKGTRAVKITWGKGHGTDAQVEAGISDSRKKQGSDQADQCADEGTFIFGEDLIKVAGIINTRHCFYEIFAVKVVRHIVEAYTIHRKMIDFKEQQKEESQREAAKTIPYIPLGYARADNCRTIDAVSIIKCY